MHLDSRERSVDSETTWGMIPVTIRFFLCLFVCLFVCTTHLVELVKQVRLTGPGAPGICLRAGNEIAIIPHHAWQILLGSW